MYITKEFVLNFSKLHCMNRQVIQSAMSSKYTELQPVDDPPLQLQQHCFFLAVYLS